MLPKAVDGTMDYFRRTAGREVQGLHAAQAWTLDKNNHKDVMKLLLNVPLSLIPATDLSSGPEQTPAITVRLTRKLAD